MYVLIPSIQCCGLSLLVVRIQQMQPPLACNHTKPAIIQMSFNTENFDCGYVIMGWLRELFTAKSFLHAYAKLSIQMFFLAINFLLN